MKSNKPNKPSAPKQKKYLLEKTIEQFLSNQINGLQQHEEDFAAIIKHPQNYLDQPQLGKQVYEQGNKLFVDLYGPLIVIDQYLLKNQIENPLIIPFKLLYKTANKIQKMLLPKQANTPNTLPGYLIQNDPRKTSSPYYDYEQVIGNCVDLNHDVQECLELGDQYLSKHHSAAEQILELVFAGIDHACQWGFLYHYVNLLAVKNLFVNLEPGE